MKKQILIGGLIGFLIGIFWNVIIPIIISLSVADGNFYPCVPSLINEVGSEIGAVILQTILSGIMGFAFGASSAIYKNDNWSLLKQSVIHFIIILVLILPIAYFLHWMQRSFWGFILYFGVTLVIYIVMWIIEYIIMKRKIKSINKKILENQEIQGEKK